MTNNLIQPKGSVSKETNKQSIARITGSKIEEVQYLDNGLDISGLKFLYDTSTETIWTLNGNETGTIYSWVIQDEDTMIITTSIQTYTIKIFESVDTLRENLSSSEPTLGASLINIGQASVRDVVRANIFSYMTKTDQLAIKGTVGTEVVVDYALQAAIDDGVMELHFPPVKGIYVLGASPVTLPSGFSMTGVSFRPYTAYSDASFNNKGTVLRLASGSPSIFILTNSHRFFNISFDGRDRSIPFMRGIGSDQTQNCQYYRCGFYRWSIGVGGSSSTGYTAGIRVLDCSIASNTIGVRNVIDSLFIGTNINANRNHGVELMTGSNNNSFIGVRNEWNDGNNYSGYGCKRILIQGELIDRAGKVAVSATGGAQFILSGCSVQRSGRLATAGSNDDAHFYLEGDTSSITLTAVYTTTGVNDDGSGRQSPSYLLATGGQSSDGKSFIASASILSGYGGSSWMRSGYVKGLSVIGCNGVEDVKNFGFRRISNGEQYLGDTSGLSLSGAGNTATLTFQTTSQDFPRYSSDLLVRTLEFRVRNNINTGAVAYYSVNLIISREQASANIAVDTASVRTFSTLSGGTWGDRFCFSNRGFSGFCYLCGWHHTNRHINSY